MFIPSFMKKLFAWGRFKTNLGKGSPVKDLPTKTSDLRGKKVTDIEGFKEALKPAATVAHAN